MQASTLRILESAQFQPAQARALAEAIEEEVKASQFITIPILDARVAEIKLGIRDLESRMFNKMITLGLTGAGLILSGVFVLLQMLRR